MEISSVFAVLWTWFPWKDSFFVYPLLSMVVNVILASVLSLITSRDNPELLEQGKMMIGLVSNASISIVTLTFSLTVLSVQIAAQSYSPRLLVSEAGAKTRKSNRSIPFMQHTHTAFPLIH